MSDLHRQLSPYLMVEYHVSAHMIATASNLTTAKGLFTWREGAPANRATRLEGLTQSVFHLPKNSGNSGRVVNGTRLFGSFHWKFSGINGISEKVVPFSRWKLPNGKFVFHLQIYCLYHQFQAFRGLLSGQASPEWDL